MNSEQRHSAESKLLSLLKGVVNLFKPSISSTNNVNQIDAGKYSREFYNSQHNFMSSQNNAYNRKNSNYHRRIG